MTNQDFLFSQDFSTQNTKPDAIQDQELSSAPPWWVLIVDDDESIHQITSLVLRGFQFEARPVQLIHAYSAKQAEQILASGEPEIALAIIDVVMESNHAGLDLVKTIRQQLELAQIRLILRTGQPGEAPKSM